MLWRVDLSQSWKRSQKLSVKNLEEMMLRREKAQQVLERKMLKLMTLDLPMVLTAIME